jgi:cysteine-rich repeat protein
MSELLMLTPEMQPTSKKRKVVAAVVGLGVAIVAGTLWNMKNTKAPSSVEFENIPIPFAEESAPGVQGSVLIGRQNGIDIYKIDLSGPASSDDAMSENKIYMISTANYAGTLPTVPFDTVMKLSNGTTAGIDYFLYQYSDANASYEIAHKNDPTFTTRFKTDKFGASSTAWANDAANGGGLAAFQTNRGITFKSTSDAVNGILMEANQRYVLVVNQVGGARISVGNINYCGNSVIGDSEQCDDGNSMSGDGCSSTCQVQSGWVCMSPGTPCTLACGNGMINAGEQCDDFNTISNDGCSSSCQVEAGWQCTSPGTACTRLCGNGVIDSGEQCDYMAPGVTTNDCTQSCTLVAPNPF